MSKGTIGVLTAILALFGAAASAEAQVGIDVVGPSAIDADDVTTTAEGNVTGATSGNYRVRFYVDGVCKHTSMWYSFSGTTIQYSPSSGISTWGLYEGAQFKTEISIKVSFVVYTDNLTITVAAGDGNYYGFVPADPLGAPRSVPAWLDRKNEAAA